MRIMRLKDDNHKILNEEDLMLLNQIEFYLADVQEQEKSTAIKV